MIRGIKTALAFAMLNWQGATLSWTECKSDTGTLFLSR